jgi:hypothetical protein
VTLAGNAALVDAAPVGWTGRDASADDRGWHHGPMGFLQRHRRASATIAALAVDLVAVLHVLASQPSGPALLGDAFVIVAVVIVLWGWVGGWSGRPR